MSRTSFWFDSVKSSIAVMLNKALIFSVAVCCLSLVNNATRAQDDAATAQDNATAAKDQSGKFKPITFDDIKMDLEAGDPYDEELLTDEIKQLEKVKIQLRGFMFPSAKQDGIKAFILVRDNQECCYGPNAAIHDCVIVRLQKGDETSFTVRPVTVQGTFYIKEFFQGRKTGRPMAVYRMRNAEIK